jgi:hypothetical protein
MIDFDALVLNTCENIFAIAAEFAFVVTAPAAPNVTARGVYSSAPLDVLMQDEITFSDPKSTLGIRTRDFDIQPGRGDTVKIVEPTHPAYLEQYWIGDSRLDGQGGALLLLRTQRPAE